MMLRTESDLRGLRREWRAFHVATVLIDVGVFERLADGAVHTLGVLAEGLRLDPRALRVCLHIAQSIGLVVRSGDGWRLPAHAPPLLRALGEASHEWRQLPSLAEVLRNGRPLVNTIGGVAVDDPAEAERFLTGLHRRSQASLPEAIAAVRRALALRPGGTPWEPRILDLGGGHGAFAAAFAKAIEGGRVTLFDRAPVLEIARRLSGDGFACRAGDYLVDDLGGPYDVVFLSNILHGEDPVVARALLARVAAATATPGALVVRDRFLDEAGAGPDYAADFALTLVFNTSAGFTRTRAEAIALLGDVGFSTVEIVDVSIEEYAYLVAAQ